MSRLKITATEYLLLKYLDGTHLFANRVPEALILAEVMRVTIEGDPRGLVTEQPMTAAGFAAWQQQLQVQGVEVTISRV